jgi:hypothetical protein
MWQMTQDSGAETMLLIQHDNRQRDQEAAMASTLAAIDQQEVRGGCVCNDAVMSD